MGGYKQFLHLYIFNSEAKVIEIPKFNSIKIV